MKRMILYARHALWFVLAVTLFAPTVTAAGRDSDRRAGQESDELRTEMRQRRLKKVEDIDEHRLPSSNAQPAATTKSKKKSDQ